MQKGVRIISRRLHLFVWPVLLVIFIEFLNRGSLTSTLGWIIRNPGEMVLNYVVIFCLFLFFTALTGRSRISFWIMSVFVLVAGLISGVKFKILGVPLLPWDLFLSSETTDIVQYLNGLFDLKTVVGIVLFFAASVGLLYFVPWTHARFRWKENIVLGILAVLIGAGMYLDKPFPVKSALNISTIPWNQADNYKLNGFMLSTVLNIEQIIIDAPQGYSQANMENFMKRVERRTNIDPNVKPNIIVILGEAFWDPTRMKNVTFSEDPVPFIHHLQKNYSSGDMMSPQFGGGTANVEFEVLSGNTVRFLPEGAIAYNQYMNRRVDSLASILARQGYQTASVNPFHNWFFNSRNVYQNFGFSKFISSEYFEAEYNGPYLQDKAVMKKIIEQTDTSAGPDFVFANTMENHAPFTPDKFAKNSIKVSGDFPEDTKGMLESLAQGVRNTDEALKMLVEHYEKKGEPTIVVLFGDHLPSMGNNFKAYKDTGYLSDSDDSATVLNKMYSLPVVVWNNYLPAHQDKLNISSAFLGPYILDLAKREGTPYTDYLFSLSKKLPVIPPRNHYERLNINDADVKEYQMLQYDILFGEQYAFGGFRDKIINPKFTLGYGEMVIDSVSPLHQNTAGGSGEDSSVQLTGKNFAPSSVVYLNDKALKTTYENRQTLSAVIPKDLASDSEKPYHFVVKVIDSKNLPIQSTPVKQLESLK
ncbi:sulfatase-like hydrolase/transferase [Paenibacillus lutrae]|uniref:Sulfatase-like hydrolase/transferase n=1 Tax=Paenibacillus lutrae TaxID=2078573 RepID=A0A7X3FI49_9BACL|nr:sulfatase-like hydrolase/transferase [Paenibacillus lutrae]MVP00209.1 sulfatase-like hydrolase/transferase [Paenibacillus lutrae]